MYETFYNFERKPFSILPDPGFLFLSAQHRRALHMLEYGLLDQAGFCVVTGEVGSGKTTLVRQLLHQLDEEITVGLVSNTKCDSFEELFRWILFGFELEYRNRDKVELYDTFVDFLIGQYKSGNRAALIIDEAQHLDPDCLEQLRMLSNVNTEQGQLLQIVLVGQPDLWNLLRRPELQQFTQRISLDYYLGPLDLADTIRYVRHRLAVAGGDLETFERNTYERICSETSGIPRLINLLCDTALVYGYAEQRQRIGLDLIDEVLKDKKASLSPLRERRDELSGSDEGHNGPAGFSTIERLYRQ